MYEYFQYSKLSTISFVFDVMIYVIQQHLLFLHHLYYYVLDYTNSSHSQNK